MASQLNDRRDVAGIVHVVRVGSPDGPVASGVVIGPDLVLTTLHATALHTTTRQRTARHAVEVSFDDRRWERADVVWESEILDTVLLRTRRAGGYRNTVWAIAESGVEVDVLGYPRLDRQLDPLPPMVEVRAVVVQEAGPMRCALVSADLAVGMSGGPVTGPNGELVGVVVGQSEDGDLVATSVSELLADDEFTRTANLAGTKPVVLSRTVGRKARAMLSPPPVDSLLRSSLPGLSGTELPYVGREREVSELVAWCEARRVRAVAVINGAWGSGKTRLATELCRIMASENWLVGFVEPGQPGWGEGVSTDAPTLLSSTAPIPGLRPIWSDCST